MSAICRGCEFEVPFVDVAGLCHDCAWVLADDPELTIDDLGWIMPGPGDVQ